MNIIQQNLNVNMIRESLENIPECALPPDFQLKWYSPGDERHWVVIHQQAEKFFETNLDLYQREFDADQATLNERQCFLFDKSGQAIGTATAWYNNDYYGQYFGRIHWVAIIPQMQGKGLSKPLMTAVCKRLRQLGHQQAYLVTSTGRIPAINLYLKFGFLPDIRNEQDQFIWHAFQEFLEKEQ